MRMLPTLSLSATFLSATFLSAVLLCATVACGSRRPPKPPANAPIPPFSSAQIAGAMPVGLHLRFQLVEAGGPPITSDWDVLSADPDTVTIRYTMRDAQGEPLGDPQQRTHTWAELVSHAAFPVEATTWSDGPATVPAGTFEAARSYVVGRVEGGGPVEDRYVFSLRHPGPPVEMTTTRFDVELTRMVLLERVEP